MEKIKSAHWADGGTGITNFPPEQFELYEEAVRRHGDHDLVVSSERMIGMGEDMPGGSLHTLGKRKDLSAFWELFRRLKDAAQTPVT